jgi:hypothetical protein
LYSSPNIIIIIITKSRWIRWARHAACKEEQRNAYMILEGKQKERDHQEDRDIDWTILKWGLDKMGWYRLD